MCGTLVVSTMCMCALIYTYGICICLCASICICVFIMNMMTVISLPQCLWTVDKENEAPRLQIRLFIFIEEYCQP